MYKLFLLAALVLAAACSVGCKECKCPNVQRAADVNQQAFQSVNIGHLLDVVATDASGRHTPKGFWQSIHSADTANKPDASKPLNALTTFNASLVQRIHCSGSQSITSHCAGLATDGRQWPKLGVLQNVRVKPDGTAWTKAEIQERNCTRANAIATGLDAGQCPGHATLEPVRSCFEQAGPVGITGRGWLQSALRGDRRLSDRTGPTELRGSGGHSWRILQPNAEPACGDRSPADQSYPGTADRIRHDSDRANSPDWINVSSAGGRGWAGSAGRTRQEDERWHTAS